MPRCAAPLAASALLAVCLVAQAPTAVATPGPAKAAWTPVAQVECYGGQLVAADFDATGARLLTAGEEGDLCLWDTDREVVRRLASGARRPTAVRIHPREPWAVVLADWCTPPAGVQRVRGCFATFCVDLGSGNTRLLWRRPVCDLAFERDGSRVAVLVADPAGRCSYELEVYRDAALLGSAPAPDFAQTIAIEGLLQFEPGGAAVLVTPGSCGPTLRVPLAGAAPGQLTGRLMTFAANGDPVWEPDPNGLDDAEGDWSVLVDAPIVKRRGPRPAEWTLTDADWTLGRHRPAAIAADGTVVVGDLHGRVHLLGDRGVVTRVPHLGVPLQLLFAKDSATLAVVGRPDATFVDCGDGSTSTLDGACAVQAVGAGDFAVLRGNDLRRFDANTHALAEPLCGWTAPGPACTTQCYWYGEVRAVPFVWVAGQPGSFECPRRLARLWLGGVESEQAQWSDALALLTGPQARATIVDRSITEVVSPRLEVTAIVPLRTSGRMLVAEREWPCQCGAGLRKDRFLGAVRLFEADSRPAKRRWLKAGVEGLRLSPNGTRAVLLPGGELIDARSLGTIVEAQADTGWLDFAFVDAEHGLATDGEHLLEVTIRTMRARPLPMPPGVARIDALAVDRSGARIAVADGGNVTLFEHTAR